MNDNHDSGAVSHSRHSGPMSGMIGLRLLRWMLPCLGLLMGLMAFALLAKDNEKLEQGKQPLETKVLEQKQAAKPTKRQRGQTKAATGKGTKSAHGPGDLYIDHPQLVTGTYPIVLLSETGTIDVDGYVASGHNAQLSFESAKVFLDSNSPTTATTLTSNTWSKTNFPCTPGLHSLHATATYTIEALGEDSAPPHEFVALPLTFYVDIGTVAAGTGTCTTCGNATGVFALDYVPDTPSGSWKRTLSPSVCTSYNKASLTITPSGTDGYVQFWIRKSGVGAPLFTYVNATWDFSTFPIELTPTQNNGSCTDLPAIIYVRLSAP